MEDEGQGAIEYILLAGGILVSAIAIFIMYTRMVTSASNKWEKGTSTAVTGMQNQMEKMEI